MNYLRYILGGFHYNIKNISYPNEEYSSRTNEVVRLVAVSDLLFFYCVGTIYNIKVLPLKV